MTRVLIVDDQAPFRQLLRRLLIRAGLSVVGEAGDIRQAEEIVPALRPDLALVDVGLPGIDGIEGARRLKALLPAMRVILISSYDDHAQVFRTAARDVGAEAFIPKDELDENTVRAWQECPDRHRLQKPGF